MHRVVHPRYLKVSHTYSVTHFFSITVCHFFMRGAEHSMQVYALYAVEVVIIGFSRHHSDWFARFLPLIINRFSPIVRA